MTDTGQSHGDNYILVGGHRAGKVGNRISQDSPLDPKMIFSLLSPSARPQRTLFYLLDLVLESKAPSYLPFSVVDFRTLRFSSYLSHLVRDPKTPLLSTFLPYFIRPKGFSPFFSNSFHPLLWQTSPLPLFLSYARPQDQDPNFLPLLLDSKTSSSFLLPLLDSINTL